MPQTVPHLWLQCWHLSPPTVVQFHHDHCMLLEVMVSLHTVHTQNTSNRLLATNITKQTNIGLLHTIQFPICHTSHNLLVEGRVSCFIVCAFQHIKLLQHQKYCAVCSPHQPQVSAVQQFPHIPLAHIYIQSQSPHCVHPCKQVILHAKFLLWIPYFVWSSIKHAFCTMKKNLHFNCTCIPIFSLYFHPWKPMTQLRYNTMTFKIWHFGIPCQYSKDRPCPIRCPTPSFA